MQIVSELEGPGEKLRWYFQCSERLLVGLKLGSNVVTLNMVMM